MNLKIKSWLNAARLRTLPLSVSGIITGTAIAVKDQVFNGWIFALAILTTLGFQILSNFANDYGDGVKGTDNEDRIGPKRAMQSGLLSAKELKKGMAITVIITLAIATLLIYKAFGKENSAYLLLFFLLGVVSIIAAIKYTVGKTAYGYKAMGDLFVFIFFGLLAVLGSYFLYAKNLYFMVVLPAVTIGLLSTAVLNLNNMRDSESDKKAGKITVPLLLGKEKAKNYHYFLIFGAYISAFCYYYFSETSWYHYLPLLAFIPLLIHTKKVKYNSEPGLLDPELKKVALSTFLFSILFLFTLLF